MRLLLNLIWLVFAGIWLVALYVVAALICFALIVTIPFGVAALRIGLYALWPFGRTVVLSEHAGVASGIANLLWLILCGWWLALGHLITGILLCLTVIGIPLGLGNFKLIPISLLPFGRRIVSVAEARALGGGGGVSVL
ncbi:YccF domain-containing protein [Conexibacter sp. DBS9H8]|uniref:YccF domain-containing protein n=1 Tax=Conexibacter sp. DBS9H8 TaxID=2937801 RepID=UPI00200FD7C1|nr:YccF domain-containing protein [Conexibacter sp. DBS9H8]